MEKTGMPLSSSENGEVREHVVAFLGPKGSYTHQAATARFTDKSYQLVPFTSIEDIFTAVNANAVPYGIVPFENSSNGPVFFTLDFFADLQGRFPEIRVTDEVYLPVNHYLLGRIQDKEPTKADVAARHLKDEVESPLVSGQVTPTQAAPEPERARAKPLHDLKHIKRLYSHTQAWGQVKAFLSTYTKQAERLDVSSTSKAAELVAKDKTGTSAAISSKMAAELNGLDILAEDIQDVVGNSTRFFILQQRSVVDAVQRNAHVDHAVEMERYKSLVSFTVNHSEPGSLAACLAVFKQFDLNLTSINTIPSGVAPWHYIFFVEIAGRKRPDGEGGEVNEALAELEKLATSYKWLGSWENALLDVKSST